MDDKKIVPTDVNVAEKAKKKKKKPYNLIIKANKKGRHILPVLNLLRILVVPTFFLFKPFRFYGKKDKRKGACIYVGNHYKMMDIVYIGAQNWECLHFVSKRENLESKFIGPFARAIKAIPVNRDGNDVRGLLDCFKCLKNGQKIAIYPEGTRNKTDQEMLPFKHGAAIMAIKTKTPVVPIVTYKRPRWFRMTDILIGEEIDLSMYYDKKLSEEEMTEADNKIRQTMLDMKAAHTKFLQDKKKRR